MKTILKKLLLACLLLQASLGAGSSLTTSLAPGGTQCFYEDSDQPDRLLEIEVFVLRGGGLDVLLEVTGPLSALNRGPLQFRETVTNIMLEESDFGDSSRHQLKVEKGLYEICLVNDNSLAQDARIIQFDIGFPKDREEDEKKAIMEAAKALELPGKMAMYKPRIKVVQNEILEIKKKQTKERHRLAIHSALNNNSHKKMVIGSIVETIILFIVSFFQVFYIRKWFSGKALTQSWV